MFLPQPAPQTDWRLTYEKSKFTETGRYSEAVSFCKRLEKASPMAKVIRYGTTPEGRPMVALLLSKNKVFAPGKSKKPLILINSGIHPGEIEGKDASLILARNIAVSKKELALIDKVDILIVPVFNVDGHERFGAYNRINQNGPKKMGWRVTSRNLNLNRDFAKADTAEMRAWLHLFQTYKPAFFFDNHTTDGGDWQYDVAYGMPLSQTQNPAVVNWSKAMLSDVLPKVAKDGHLTSPYFSGFDPSAPQKGFAVEDFSLRYSTGYGAAVNRASMLVETHVLKPYKTRVEATYSLNKRVIQYCGKTSAQLAAANSKADAQAAAGMEGHTVVLSTTLADAWRPFVFYGYAFKAYQSEISGAEIPSWDRKKPITVQSRIRDQFVPSAKVIAPYAYAIPPQWNDVIAVCGTQGIRMSKLTKPAAGVFWTYRFENIRFPTAPFEGRFMPSYGVAPIRERRELPAGTVIIRTAQPLGKLAINLLEPIAPDSLAHWGFFNAMFEEKEFFEDYTMEPIAKKMLESDPELKRKFQEALKDPAFANNPRQRLAFFWDRSPYFDKWLKKYPIVRLSKADAAKLK